MSRKKFSNIFLIIIVVLSVCTVCFAVYCFFNYRQGRIVKPYWMSADDGINSFVKKNKFPNASKADVFIETPEQNLKIFSVSYGELHDCYAGCFSSSATGIKHGDKIGWISVNDYDNIDKSKLAMYDFDVSDTYFYSDEFLQLLESPKYNYFYKTEFFPQMVKDKDVPRDVLLKIANNVSWPYTAGGLLENTTVKNDCEVLTIISRLPGGDVYSKKVRAKAQGLLNDCHVK